MGMFDSVWVRATCPACGKEGFVEAQTKNLDCDLASYEALSLDWETNEHLGKPFRSGLPVFPAFPLDKSAAVWANQAEKMEAQATPPKEKGEQLRYIVVHEICKQCGAFWEGKVMIVDGLLRSPVQEAEVL